MKTAALFLALAAASAAAQTTTRATAPRAPLPAARSATPAQPQKPKPIPEILEFSPKTVPYDEDGLIIERVCFTSAHSRILLPIPGGWDLDRSQPTASFRYKLDGRATITFLPSNTPLLPLDTEERRKATRESILSSLPRDAEKKLIASEAENPTVNNGWTSYQFIAEYVHFGQRYQKQVIIIRLHAVQEIQVVTIAPEHYAGAAANATGQLLASWYREPLKTRQPEEKKGAPASE